MSSDLWGIDDPQEVQRIERAVNVRTRSLFRVLLYLGGSGAFAAVIGTFLVPSFPVLGRMAAAGVFLFGVVIYSAGEFSRYLRAKSEVLASMGRCLSCGYKLDPRTEACCPECGRSRDSPAQPLR